MALGHKKCHLGVNVFKFFYISFKSLESINYCVYPWETFSAKSNILELSRVEHLICLAHTKCLLGVNVFKFFIISSMNLGKNKQHCLSMGNIISQV